MPPTIFCEKYFCNVTWLSGQVSLAGLVCSLQCVAPSNIKNLLEQPHLGRIIQYHSTAIWVCSSRIIANNHVSSPAFMNIHVKTYFREYSRIFGCSRLSPYSHAMVPFLEYSYEYEANYSSRPTPLLQNGEVQEADRSFPWTTR